MIVVVSSVADRAAALLVEVESEQRRPTEDRRTHAADACLDRVATVR